MTSHIDKLLDELRLAIGLRSGGRIVVPWVEDNSVRPEYVEPTKAGLRQWARTTTAAIVTTKKPAVGTIWAMLKTPDISVLPGVKTSEYFPGHGDNVEQWRMVGDDISRMHEITGAKWITLENEGLLRPIYDSSYLKSRPDRLLVFSLAEGIVTLKPGTGYQYGNTDLGKTRDEAIKFFTANTSLAAEIADKTIACFDWAGFEAGIGEMLSRVPQGVEVWWYPASLAEEPGVKLTKLVASVGRERIRFFDFYKCGSHRSISDAASQVMSAMIADIATNAGQRDPITMVYSGVAGWPVEWLPEAIEWCFRHGSSVVCPYPGFSDWERAGAEVAAARRGGLP